MDCRINNLARPLFVFALNNDNKVRDATITLLNFRSWGVRLRAIGVFADQEEVARPVLARFSDVADKQFSALAGHEAEIGEYLLREMGE